MWTRVKKNCTARQLRDVCNQIFVFIVSTVQQPKVYEDVAVRFGTVENARSPTKNRNTNGIRARCGATTGCTHDSAPTHCAAIESRKDNALLLFKSINNDVTTDPADQRGLPKNAYVTPRSIRTQLFWFTEYGVRCWRVRATFSTYSVLLYANSSTFITMQCSFSPSFSPPLFPSFFFL
jgi:hypothetical protein